MTIADNKGSRKAAIFDLDGTLLDSMGVWDQVDIDFLARRGIPVPDDYMAKVAPMQFRQIAEYTIARFGLNDTPEQLMDEWDEMARVAYATQVEAKPGALDYLRELKARGVRLGVATSLPPRLREPALGHVGMLDLFDEIVSVDDANDVGKDRPDVYLLAARRLGVEPADCTVFEDLLVAIRSAKSVGMTVWAMHDDSSDADWPEICELADGVLFDFRNAPRDL
ncbi:beta-phosphoglucomutase [Bifidobacterium callitrichos]|uniref:Beta-phosphoglucomutase n=1 Tax=Bifidobacterium callitrichos TaxID=762209 RepID=A0A2T3GDE1_9BIFI|nr:HAD family phosphatase [Bifidobacterium callitrichos]PST47482.1 beta-phosphoglucomutase [Bifidobacterium callitrichos]